MKPKVYVAGPITGIENYNRDAFSRRTDQLRRAGFEVVNPHETCRGVIESHEGGDKELWLKCMKADVRELVTCDYITLLPGWETSKGCRIEVALCRELEIKELKIYDEVQCS